MVSIYDIKWLLLVCHCYSIISYNPMKGNIIIIISSGQPYYTEYSEMYSDQINVFTTCFHIRGNVYLVCVNYLYYTTEYHK